MLLTKLHIPAASQNIVHRPQLYAKLDTGLSRKLILISAPAGFGKTTVVSDWIHQQKIPAAWFSLDKGDNDPVEFLNYIISGIQGIRKSFGASALGLLNSPNRPSGKSIAGLLINELLRLAQNFVLVLDDYHLVESSEILELTAYLLEHLPTNVHIVILTRSDPALSVSKLRSQQQLVELRSSDLSFSTNEISILFNKKLKLGLSAEDINSLEVKTEGWIAGLQLSAISMQGRANISGYIQEFKGDNRYIMDYLMEEVLRIQSDDIKEFLLKTSILEQMSAPLCNDILSRNDSQFILEELEKNNMFVIPLDGERNWYRYHHLFADLLNQRLQLHFNDAVKDLHNKTCDWFERHNMHELAIEHALKIKNHEKCIQLLGKVAEDMWQNGLHAAIMKYGNSLPDELIKTNPDFCLYYSWILISAGQIQKALPFLSCAEMKVKQLIQEHDLADENTHHLKKLLGKISVAFAYLSSHEEHSAKAFDYCKTAMEILSEDDPLWFSWAWFSYGVSYFTVGELNEGSKAFDKALEYGKKSGNIYLISVIVIRMAENEQQLGHYKSAYKKCTDLLVYIKKRGYTQIAKAEWTFAALYLIMSITETMWADTRKAFDHIKIAYQSSRDVKDIFMRVMILMMYSTLLRMTGDVTAETRMNELDEIMKQNEIPPFLVSMYVTWKSHYLLQQNQNEEAGRLFSDYGIGSGKEKTHLFEMCNVSYAYFLLKQGNIDEAGKLISELYASVSEGQRIERMIELKLISVDFYKKRGDRKNALKNLMEALEIASEENLLSFFVYNYVDIDDLYEEAFKIQATTKTKIPDKFIHNIKTSLEERNNSRKNISEALLSSRELDTLNLIARDLPNQEIADKLFISLNTVKTHLKNIYLKLEVDNRSKAVSRAKELKIL